MKKIINYAIIFVFVLCISNKVNAGFVKIMSGNNDNMCYLQLSDHEKIAFKMDGVSVYGQDMYKMRLGNNDALCLNYYLKVGIAYHKVASFQVGGGYEAGTASIYSKIYNYSKTDYFGAQIALWSYVRTGNVDNTLFTKKYNDIDKLASDHPDFVQNFNNNHSGVSICSNTEGIKNTGDEYYDCDLFKKTEEEFVKSHNGSVTYNIALKKNVGNDQKSRNMLNYYRDHITDDPEEYLSKGTNTYNVNTGGMTGVRSALTVYNGIVDAGGNNPVEIWCPIEDEDADKETADVSTIFSRKNDNNKFGQCVIVPTNTSCETCTSTATKLMKQHPNWSAEQVVAELQKKWKNAMVYKGAVTCGREECTEYIKSYKKYPDVYRDNALSKYKDRISKYKFKVTIIKNTLSCGPSCDYKTLIDEYNGDCTKFTAAMIKNNYTVKKCDAVNKVVECGMDSIGKPTCEELITMSSNLSCNEFKSKVSDPDKVECINGKPSCASDCKPYIEEYACSFTSQNGGFYMSDTGEKGVDNRACYYDKGYGYRLNGTTYASDTDNFGNEYCAIKCWEAFGGVFPGAVKGLAGQVLYWGRGSYYSDTLGSANAYRYCYTENINYSKFSSDWNASEAAILNAYNSWSNQNQYVSNDVIASGACELTAGCSSEKEETQKVACGNYNSHGDCGDNDCSWDGNCWTRKIKSCNSCPSGYTLSGNSCKKAGTNYKKNKVGDSTDGGTRCIANDITDKNAEYNNVTGANTELTARKNTLVNLEKNRQALYTKITSCSTNTIVNENSIYKFTTEATLKFEDPKINSRNVNAKLPYEDVTQMFSSNGTPNGSSVSFWCNNIGNFQTFTSCNALINQYSNYHWEVEKIRLFKYPSNMRWIAMMQNYELKNDMNNNETYHYIGYGIPTAFGTVTGYYGGTGNDNLKGQLSLVITGFGHNGHFDALVDTMESGTGNSYSYACPYYVKNEITQHECNYLCDDGTRTCKLVNGSPVKCNNGDNGLDLVYRVIDMAAGDQKRIFPSIDGDGRSAGANWATFINTQAEAFKNITTYSTIYDNKPIYHIDLTPSMISDIRNSNKEYRNASIDPYASYKTVNNTNKIVCNSKSGANKSCISKYITELIKKYPNNITGEYVSINENSRLNAIDCGKSRYNTSNITTCKAN